MKPEIALVQCNFRHTFAIPSLLHSENVHEIRDDVINSDSNEQFTSDDTDSFVLILCQTRLKEKEHGIILSAPSLSLSLTHTYMQEYTNIQTYTHMHVYTYTCINIDAYIDTSKNASTYIHKHAHTHKQSHLVLKL